MGGKFPSCEHRLWRISNNIVNRMILYLFSEMFMWMWVGTWRSRVCIPWRGSLRRRFMSKQVLERSIFKRSKWIHFKRIVDCSALMYWRRLKIWRWWWITCRLSILTNSSRHWWTIWVVQNQSSGSRWCLYIISRCLKVFINHWVKQDFQHLICIWYIRYCRSGMLYKTWTDWFRRQKFRRGSCTDVYKSHLLSQLNECDVNGFQDLSGSFL